jgi:mRNA interferase HigB
MHIFSKKALRDFWTKHPQAEGPLKSWFSNVSHAKWKMFADVKKDYGSVDLVGSYLVFNIGGNKYRLIAPVHYKGARVYVRAVLTHDEYDQDDWKN